MSSTAHTSNPASGERSGEASGGELRPRGRRRSAHGSATVATRVAGKRFAREGGSASALVPAPPPAIAGAHVPRARLREALEGADGSLVLLAAPAGYGKTRLLSEWSRCDERAFAWLTLADADNDGAQLVSRIASALGSADVLEHGAHDELTARRRSDRTAGVTALLRHAGALMRSIAAARVATVLVLDDVHTLHSEESLAVLNAFAVGMPSGSLLALASRTLPALPLGRLRVSRALVALGARELAMTEEEALELLRAEGLDEDREVVSELLARTEGWPAALSLAALSLRGQTDAASAARSFDGCDGDVREYIEQELLAPCAPALRSFLVKTSVLELLWAGACDALLEREDARGMLRAAASSSLPLQRADRRERGYRCHPLLRDALSAELEQSGESAARELHRRASRWLSARGELDLAMSSALAAVDAALVGDLAWAHCSNRLMDPRDATPARWIGAFTDAEIGSCASLALCAAHERLARGEIAMAEHFARVASASLDRVPKRACERSLAAGVRIVEAAACRHGIGRMREHTSEAARLLDEPSPWRALAALLGGVAAHVAGDPQAAREQLQEGARRSSPPLPSVESQCLAQLAMIAAQEDDWEQASDLATLARERVEQAELGGLPTSALVFAVAAWVSAHDGLAAGAKADLRRATQLLELLGDHAPWHEVEVRVALAHAAVRLADVALARTLLAEASRFARRMPDATIFRAWLDEAWAEIDDLGVAALGGACSLTVAELRILRFLPTHLSFREIGARLHVSTNTVKSQAHAIYAKLAVASRSEAVARASALGLIEADVI